MENIKIRRFIESDAKELSNIIRRNFLEVNIKDYSHEDMNKAAELFTEEKIISQANLTNSYTALIDNKVVGCGSISAYFAHPDQSILLTIFVSPDYHKMRIGTKIIETLEQDEYFLRSKRIEIPASITACEFYRKLGYDYKNGVKELDGEGHYRLEKFREI